MNLSRVRIQTERLILRPAIQADARNIFREFMPAVTQYMYPAPHNHISETKAFIAQSRIGLRPGTNLFLVILAKTSREFLGCLGLHEIGSECPEFGVWLKMSAHGHGFGREAVAALKEWADVNLACREYKYPVDVRNRPSCRIPEKLGGTIVRRYTETNMSGRILEMAEYRIPGAVS